MKKRVLCLLMVLCLCLSMLLVSCKDEEVVDPAPGDVELEKLGETETSPNTDDIPVTPNEEGLNEIPPYRA